jgi:hypothetical protein
MSPPVLLLMEAAGRPRYWVRRTGDKQFTLLHARPTRELWPPITLIHDPGQALIICQELKAFPLLHSACSHLLLFRKPLEFFPFQKNTVFWDVWVCDVRGMPPTYRRDVLSPSSRSRIKPSALLITSYRLLAWITLEPQDGDTRCLQNVGEFITNDTASSSRS